MSCIGRSLDFDWFLQAVDLTGMANRTDTQWQVEFAGTLAQRRKLYQERRLKNGIEAGRVIKRMREETGLTKESNANGDQASAWKVRFQGGSH
jgi:hypothetical protein